MAWASGPICDSPPRYLRPLDEGQYFENDITICPPHKNTKELFLRQIKMKVIEQTIIAPLPGNHYPGFTERLAQAPAVESHLRSFFRLIVDTFRR